MKTISILTLVTAGFWLTLFTSSFNPAKPESPGNNFQPAANEPSSTLPQGWMSDLESGFAFTSLSEEHDKIQIELGLGTFEPQPGHGFQKKLRGKEAPNINPRAV
ncbi:MAG: hypothetical protein NPINA01_25350 [Nitrospinaceae bacterium]|nr:MAG: hypothetical protein NPINA01_25350 [Nitrospinaceae bacterium]